MSIKTSLMLILLFQVVPDVSLAATEEKAIGVDEAMVRQWNRFADKVLALHKSTIAKVEYRKEVRSGGYTGDYFNDPDFYIEETYFAKSDGRLLSRVQWEKDNPDRVHVIEVYVYDSKNRLVRDYLVAYLPWGRNAPIQAFLNLHVQADSVKGFRQFDASGERIYERCDGQVNGQKVNISLFSDQIVPPFTEQNDYRYCFAELPKEGGIYLDPQ
jgi:hypothetical protein